MTPQDDEWGKRRREVRPPEPWPPSRRWSTGGGVVLAVVLVVVGLAVGYYILMALAVGSAQLSMRQAGWPALAAAAVIAALAAVVTGQARAMLHYGPVMPRAVLPEFAAEEELR